jgi:hypothetical protein
VGEWAPRPLPSPPLATPHVHSTPRPPSLPFPAQENVYASWGEIWALADEKGGLQEISEAFRLCAPLRSREEVWKLLYWVQTAWSYLAMGDYPYESTYILNGLGTLPAFPVDAACQHLSFDRATVSASPHACLLPQAQPGGA